MWIVVQELRYDDVMMYGLWTSAAAAEAWMNEQPDDEDTYDMYVAYVNVVARENGNLTVGGNGA